METTALREHGAAVCIPAGNQAAPRFAKAAGIPLDGVNDIKLYASSITYVSPATGTCCRGDVGDTCGSVPACPGRLVSALQGDTGTSVGIRSTWTACEEFQSFRPNVAVVWVGRLRREMVFRADERG